MAPAQGRAQDADSAAFDPPGAERLGSAELPRQLAELLRKNGMGEAPFKFVRRGCTMTMISSDPDAGSDMASNKKTRFFRVDEQFTTLQWSWHDQVLP